MERLAEIKEELENILRNFRKSTNRPYTNETLIRKQHQVHDLYKEAKENTGKVTKAENIQEIKNTYAEIRKTVLTINDIIENQRKLTTMSFDIRTATSLLHTYDGKENETEAFIESMELLDELTQAEHKGIMVKFIRTRITGKAKSVLTDDIKTVAQIKAKLKEKFTVKLSSDAILAQLRNCKQGNRKLTDFSKQVEDLSSLLTRAFISENVATNDTAEKLAEKFSVQAFINNIENSETSLILKATNLSTLNELVTKAVAVDKPAPSKILYYNRQQNNGFRNSFNRQTPTNNYRNFSGRNFRFQQNRYRQSNNFRNINNNNNYNNSNTNNSRGNNNRSTFRNNQRTNRINIVESGELQTPQPDERTIRLGENENNLPEFSP